jgi:O-antigen ligase
MAGTVGISKSVHNSYLELLTAGGLFGLLALGKYYVTVRRSLRRSDQPDDSAEHLQTQVEITAVVGAVAVMALFLTLNYSSIFWLPAVLALAWRYRSAPVEAQPPIR